MKDMFTLPMTVARISSDMSLMAVETIGIDKDPGENPSASSVSKTGNKKYATVADDTMISATGSKVDATDSKIATADLKTVDPNDYKLNSA